MTKWWIQVKLWQNDEFKLNLHNSMIENKIWQSLILYRQTHYMCDRYLVVQIK